MSRHAGRLASLALVVAAALAGCRQPDPPEPVTWRAAAAMPDGGTPDLATLNRARDMVAARLRIGSLPPTQVSTEGSHTLLIRLAWEDDYGWDVAERLRPGRVLLRPVRGQAVEPPELRDVSPANQPSLDQLATMSPQAQFSTPMPTCALLIVREPVETADPSKPIAACNLDKLTATKYLLGPALLVEQDIAAVQCTTGPDDRSELTFSFTQRGRTRTQAATGSVAVVLDGFVMATVDPKVRNDQVTIRGHFMSPQVAVVCAEPRYAPLPLVLRPQFAW